MLHARDASPIRQCLVKRVLCRGCAELLAVARAETPDAVGVEQRLRGWHEHECVSLVGRTLVGGIEAPDAVDLVAKKIEPEGKFFASWKQIDEGTSNRIFAVLRYSVGPLVTERVQLLDQRFTFNSLLFDEAARQLTDPEGREQTLCRSTYGSDHQLGLFALCLQRA